MADKNSLSPWDIEERVYFRFFKTSFKDDLKAVRALNSRAFSALLRLAEWDPTLLCNHGFPIVLEKLHKRDKRYFKLLGEAIKGERRKKHFRPQRKASERIWFGLAFSDSRKQFVSLIKTAKGRRHLLDGLVKEGLLEGHYQDERDFKKFLEYYGFL